MAAYCAIIDFVLVDFRANEAFGLLDEFKL